MVKVSANYQTVAVGLQIERRIERFDDVSLDFPWLGAAGCRQTTVVLEVVGKRCLGCEARAIKARARLKKKMGNQKRGHTLAKGGTSDRPGPMVLGYKTRAL